MATLRLVRAAERAGARRFLFFSALGASHHSRTRFFRAKALAQDAVADSSLETTTFSPSIVYSPGDPWLTLLERFSYLPAIPMSGSGDALYQPIWAEDVADGVVAALRNGQADDHPRYGASPGPTPCPTTTSCGWRCVRRGAVAVCCTCRFRSFADPFAAAAARGSARVRHLGRGGADGGADGGGVGTADAEALGVRPHPMAAVLGLTGAGPRPVAGAA